MTRDEAKALLLNISAYDIDTQRGMKKQEAIEMAIKALEQEPCDKCVYSTSEGCQYDDITETIPPFETSDYCVSRQAVNILVDELARAISDERCCMPRGRSTGAIMQDILDLPPVTPQPKNEDISKAFQLGLAFGFGESHNEMNKVIDELKKVITPQPKTGHWVEEIISVGTRKVFCSECGCSASFEHVSNGDVYSASGYGVINKTKFCPNCGARMFEPQESEDKE